MPSRPVQVLVSDVGWFGVQLMICGVLGFSLQSTCAACGAMLLFLSLHAWKEL